MEHTSGIFVDLTEDEIELLAEYGTRDANDAVLPPEMIRNASTFTSDYGGQALFLTGLGQDRGNSSHPADDLDASDVPALVEVPLELFVLRTMHTTSAVASSYLSAAVASVVYDAAATKPLRRPSSSVDLLSELEAMGAEADAELARRDYHYNGHKDEARAFAAIMFDMYEEGPNADNDVPATSQPNAETNYIEDSELLSSAEQERIVIQVTERLAKLEAARLNAGSFAPLYDGEEEESIKRRIDQEHQEEDLRRRREVYGELVAQSVRNMTSGIFEGLPANVLAMATVHSREEDDMIDILNIPLEAPMSAVRVSHSTTTPATTTSSLVDRLVPEMAGPDRNPTSNSAGTETIQHTQAIRQPVANTERMIKVQKRKQWLLVREAAERANMRVEEDCLLKIQRAVVAVALNDAKDRLALEASEGVGRRATAGEEALGMADISRRADKQRKHLIDWELHQTQLRKAKAANDVQAEESAVRSTIITDELEGRDDIHHRQSRHLAQLDRHYALRGALVTSAETAHQGLIRDELDEWSDLLTLHCRAETLETLRKADLAAAERRKQLERESARQQQERAEVEVLMEVGLQALLQGLDLIALRQAIEQQCDLVHINRRRHGNAEVPRAQTPPPSTKAGGMVLDDTLFKKVQDSCFSALANINSGGGILASAHLAPTILFRSLSFALEHITDVDSAAIGKLTVPLPARRRKPNGSLANSVSSPAEVMARRPSTVSRLRALAGGADRAQHICPLVHHLNLDNNEIHTLNWEGLMGRTFGWVQRLTLAGNALEGEALASLLSDCPRLVQIDLSANRITSLQGIQHFTMLTQLVAYGNSLEGLPTDLAAACPLLSVIEVSRNKLTDLTPLRGLRMLQTLDCSRNSLSSLEPVAESLLLQNLYASNNNLTCLPKGLRWPSLRHLFISDNRLTHLNPIVAAPFLTVLQADSNVLVSIEGLRGCPLLHTVSLSFNDLPNAEALLPLGYCPATERLSISDNPCLETERKLSLSVALYLCPRLRELNSDLVAQQAAKEVSESELQSAIFPWAAVRAKQQEAAKSNALLESIQKEYLAMTLHFSRQEQRAMAAEKKVESSIKGNAIRRLYGVARDSSEAFVDKQLGTALLLSRHLLLLLQGRDKAGHGSDLFLQALESSSPSFALAIDRGAGGIIRRFLSGCIAIRRARLELAQRKAVTTRYHDAATVIQAAYRGHSVRRRLKGAGFEDDDDLGMFKKVEIPGGMTTSQGAGMDSLVRNTLLQRGTAPVFEVRGAVKTLDITERTGSAPMQQVDRKAPMARPASQPTSAVLHQPSPPRNATADDEWSVAMRQHADKKRQKVAKQHADTLRREYISDPLKAKSIQSKR